MALFGLIKEGNEQVLTEYKADIKDHKSAIKELEGAEKELAAVELENLEARHDGMETTIRKLGQVAFAAVALKETVDVVWDGYKEGLHESQLESAALGVDIEGLSRAAGGLKTNLELLEFAAKANNSAFHNTQEDMEVAERAIRKLEARGVPAADAVDAITNALVSAKVKGLIPLGIVVDSHIDKLASMGEENMTAAQKLEVHSAAMEQLRKFTDGTNDAQDNLGDSMKRAQVQLSNSWAELKIGLGQLAVAMVPLLAALSKTVELVAGIVNGSSALFGSVGLDDAQRMLRAKQAFAHGASAEDALSILSGKAFGNAFGGDEFKPKGGDEIDMDPMDLRGGIKKDRKDAAEAARDQAALERYSARLDREYDIWKTHHDKWLAAGNRSLGGAIDTRLGTAAVENDNDFEGGAFEAIMERQARERDADAAKAEIKKKTMVERMFGSVDEINVAKDMFGGLTSAVTSGYKAMVEGSMSFGQAFKGSVANMLEAEGSKMQILAIENTAMGFAALALGPIGGTSASQFFTAAGMFEAGAVLAGVAASALGAGRSGGSGGGSSSAPGAPQSYGPQASNSNMPRTNIIVIGDAFADDSIRARQLKAQKYFGLATGVTGTENG